MSRLQVVEEKSRHAKSETHEESITWDEYCQFFDSSLSLSSIEDIDDQVTAL